MQPVSGFSKVRINGTGAGTTVIKAFPTVLHAIVIGQNKTGTVTFYDDATGTSSGRLIDIDNTCGTRPLTIPIGMQMRNGIVAELGGTTDMLVIYQ